MNEKNTRQWKNEVREACVVLFSSFQLLGYPHSSFFTLLQLNYNVSVNLTETKKERPGIDIIVVPFVPLFNEKVTKRVRHAFHLTKDKAKNNNGMRSEERRAFFARFFTVHSSLFFIYWIKTKEKGVRSLTLFPLVFYSIKEQQRTSVKSKNKRKQMSACFALFTCFFSLCWKWSVKKGRGAHSTCPLLSSFHFIFNTTPSFSLS